MISVPFELGKVEFGMLIPGTEKSQKECCLSHKLAQTVKTSDGKFYSINYIER